MMKRDAERALEHFRTQGVDIRDPFKLFYVDGALPHAVVECALRAFPDRADLDSWEVSRIGDVESKRRSTWTSEYDIPEGARDVVQFMNSALFLRFMSERFDIPKIMPDPYFTGGGLNESLRGDYLDVHIDGNYHDASGLNRRLNAILYLNPEWDTAWGGGFGMYTDGGKTLAHELAPIFNRLVVFETSDTSFHGFPEPLACPEGVSRRSIILYYYTKAQHDASKVQYADPHSAMWVKHGVRDKSFQTARPFT
jgi:Rps23 Pro-64 3,4-dihydroxylase Tpa1-like proline 4-hydroxylase